MISIFRILRLRQRFAILALLLNSLIAYSQDLHHEGSLSLTIDNDFLNYRGRGTDRYYTNGIGLEYCYAKIKKSFIDNILLGLGNNAGKYSHWALTQLMYTPNNISDSAVLRNDWPYAATLYLTKGLTTFSDDLNLSLQSEINLGLIGPYSFGKDMQCWVHKMINYQRPNGWDNQIKTDIVFNYNITVSKQLFSSKNMQWNMQIASRAGTLYNDLAIGFDLLAGRISPYTHSFRNISIVKGGRKKNNREIYFFSQAKLKLVLGNSLLEGGFIHSFKNGCDDFYHINEDDMKRLVSLCETGVTVNTSRWCFVFSQNFISAEFKEAESQLFGRIRITYKF